MKTFYDYESMNYNELYEVGEIVRYWKLIKPYQNEFEKNYNIKLTYFKHLCYKRDGSVEFEKSKGIKIRLKLSFLKILKMRTENEEYFV